jgi:hypothetical protein
MGCGLEWVGGICCAPGGLLSYGTPCSACWLPDLCKVGAVLIELSQDVVL